MIKTTVMNEDIGGALFNYHVYTAIAPTKNYVICFPGVNEVSATMVTQLEALDWYPKYAGNGTLEADFNIIAVQPHVSANLFGATGLGVINFLSSKYGIQNLVTVGISGGGTAASTAMFRDINNNLRGVVVFSGTYSAVTNLQVPTGQTLASAKDVPAYLGHNATDGTVSPTVPANFISGVNANTTRSFPLALTSFAASGHSSWNGKMTANKAMRAFLNSYEG